MATSRPNRVSWARYTSPMPPAPRGDWISYGPSLVPEIRAIGAGNYSLCSTLHADGNGSGRVVGNSYLGITSRLLVIGDLHPAQLILELSGSGRLTPKYQIGFVVSDRISNRHAKSA